MTHPRIHLLHVVAIAAVLPLFTGLTRGAEKEVRDPKMTLFSVARMQEYPPPPNNRLRVKEGYEFVEVCLQVAPQKIDDLYSERDATLVDSEGEKHGVAWAGLSSRSGETVPSQQQFVFAVKKGQTLKHLDVGPYQFSFVPLLRGASK